MSPGAASNLELRRAAWRHQHHYLSASYMARLLRPELERVAQERHALAGGEATVRRHEAALLDQTDGALSRAAYGVDVEDYVQATGDILAARRGCARIAALLRADEAIDRAREVVERALALVEVPRLRELPSLAAAARLLEVARDRMRAGRYLQAGYLADACVRQAEPLSARVEQPAAAIPALDEIEALCEATRHLVADPAADLPADGTLGTLRARAAEGYGTLAERLSAELLLTLAPRLQFRRELARGGAGRPGHLPHEVRQLLLGDAGGNGWAPATSLLRRLRLERAGVLVALHSFAPEPSAAAAADPAPASLAGSGEDDRSPRPAPAANENAERGM